MTVLNFKTQRRHEIDRDAGDSRESVFLDHYEWLLQCAMRYTHGQVERAEDLVQDAFVQFQTGPTELASLANARGYLGGIVRNLHLSHLRRSFRHPVEQLPVIDHDSAGVGIQAYGSSENHLEALDLLIRGCEYICFQKDYSATASLFALRFFHGYFPDEIARLLNSNRTAVNKSVGRGRVAIKAYLKGGLSSAQQPLPVTRLDLRISSPRLILAQLRESIFSSCRTICSEIIVSGEELDCASLAHLVSCRECLDKRSCKQGVPSVGNRMMDEFSGRDDQSGRTNDDRDEDGGDDGPGRSPVASFRDARGSRASRLRRGYARMREMFEHKPSELRIAIDGHTRAALKVNGPVNALSLAFTAQDNPEFVAVISEQEVHLLILAGDQLSPVERTTYTLPLSGGRRLEATVTPELLGPAIHVCYLDPELTSAGDSESSLADLPVSNQSEEAPSVEYRPQPRLQNGRFRALSWLSRWRSLAKIEMPDFDPTLATAIVLALFSICCFLLWLHRKPAITAKELLERARAWDDSSLRQPSGSVVCQTVRIRTPHLTVERTIHRDLSRKRVPRRTPLKAGEAVLKNNLQIAGVDWDAPLSASSLEAWLHNLRNSRGSVVRRRDGLLDLLTSVSDGPVASESITVRTSDFHPVRRTIAFRDSEEVEIVEVDFSVVSGASADSSWFESYSEPGASPQSKRPRLPSLAPLPTEDQLDLAELQARLLLNRMDDSISGRLHIARASEGIQIQGIVPDDAERRRIAGQVQSLPHVKALLVTFAEVSASPTPEGEPSGLTESSVVAAATPLETYLLAKGLDRNRIGGISHSIFSSSAELLRTNRGTVELDRRFARAPLQGGGRKVFDELLALQRAQMMAALDEQERALDGLPFAASRNDSSGNAQTTVPDLIANNARLSTELVSSAEPSFRPVEEILQELRQNETALRGLLRRSADGSALSHALSSEPSGRTVDPQ